MARDTIASLRAELDSMRASLTSTPAAPSEASEHYKARDLAVTCCDKTFRTTKGRAFHLANTHPKGKVRA